MTRFAPLFAISLLAACAPATVELSDVVVVAEPGDSTPVDTTEQREPTLTVQFTTTWPLATVACVLDNKLTLYTAEFDNENWADFYGPSLESCSFLFFNVAEGDLQNGLTFNANPYLLAEIGIDEASDTVELQDQPDLEPFLDYWVFNGPGFEQGEMLVPASNGYFWKCWEPQWIFYGMPYVFDDGGANIEDRCETTPSG